MGYTGFHDHESHNRHMAPARSNAGDVRLCPACTYPGRFHAGCEYHHGHLLRHGRAEDRRRGRSRSLDLPRREGRKRYMCLFRQREWSGRRGATGACAFHACASACHRHGSIPCPSRFLSVRIPRAASCLKFCPTEFQTRKIFT